MPGNKRLLIVIDLICHCYPVSIMRTIIDLPDEQTVSLKRLCETRQISFIEAVREAVALYLADAADPQGDEAFGIWKDRNLGGLSCQHELRDERF